MGAVRVVNADPVVGGLPTYGWTTGIQVGADGQVVGGSGQLKKPVKGDAYPVISAERDAGAAERGGRARHRCGIGGCATPVPLEGRAEAAGGIAPCEPAARRLRSRGGDGQKAVFGLAAHSVDGQPGAGAVLAVRGGRPGAERRGRRSR